MTELTIEHMTELTIEHFVHGERAFVMVTPEELRRQGVPETAVAQAVAGLEKLRARDALRQRIASEAGDVQSLLGTTADVAALGLIGMMQLLIILAEKGSADVKAAIGSAPIPMPIDKAKALIAAIAAGKVKVPALLKGLDTVYAEIAARSTATVEALTAKG